MLVRQVHA